MEELKLSKEIKQSNSAVGAGHHGNLYQIKLLMYSTLIANNKGYPKFKVSTERPEFGKYDDISIEYSTLADSNVCDRLILMQAKHILNPEQHLLNENSVIRSNKTPFCIYMYFKSYIKFHEKKINDKIDGIYVLTNSWFEDKVKRKYFIPNNFRNYFDFGEAYELNEKGMKSLKRYNDLQATEDDYEQFQKKFVFITTTPSEDKLDEYIEKEMKVNLRITFSELKVFSANFFYFVSDMLCREIKPYLTFNKIKELYDYFKLKVSTLKKFGTYNYGIQFSSDDQLVSELTNFFENDYIRKIFIKTSNFSITKYRLWQCIPQKFKLNGQIILVTEKDMKSENLFQIIRKNFCFSDTVTIMELVNVGNEMDMIMKWIAEAEGHQTSRLIIISTLELSSASNVVYDGFNFLSLTETSKNQILDTKIEFLYDEITLKEIFQNDRTIVNDDKWLPCDTLNIILDVIRKENNGEMVKRFSILKNFSKISKDDLYIKRKLIFKDNDKFTKVENEDLIINEENIFNYFSNFDNIIIVTAVMGMGKSLLLESIEQEFQRICKINRIFELVARIDLVSLQSEILDNFKFVTLTKERTLELLVECFAFGTISPHLKFFKNVITYYINKAKPLLLIDGFDEVAPIYTELLLNFMKNVRMFFSNVRLIVTSRPNIEKDFIKHKFQHIGNIKNFSEKEQINYLMKFWSKNITLSKYISNEMLKKLAGYLVEFKLKSKTKNKITGIPLLIYMFAHIYENKLKKFIKNVNVSGDPNLISNEKEFENLFMNDIKENFNLIVLYDQFMENQIDYHYKEKEQYDIKENQFFSAKTGFYEEFFEDHEALALLTVFSKSELKQMDIYEVITEKCQYLIKRISKDEHKFGIIRFLKNKEDLYFMHLSYAEYFSAKFFCKSLQENSIYTALINKFFITRVLRSNLLESVILFCDEWLKIHSILEIRNFKMVVNDLTTFVDESTEEQVDNLRNYHTEKIEFCVTHLVRLFQFNICAALLFYLDNDIRTAIVNRSIDEHENKILHYVAEYNEKVLAEYLIEYGADISLENVWGSSCIYVALKNGNFEIAKLLEKCYTLGNLGILEFKNFLFKTVIKEQCDDRFENNDVDMTEVCSNSIFESQNRKVEENSSYDIESYVTLNNLNFDFELFDKFIAKMSQIESKNLEDFSKQWFILASRCGNTEILNYLLNLKLYNKKTIEKSLLEAAIYGHLHVLEILLHKVENVNEIRNDKGNSLLILACQFNNYEIVQYVLNQKNVETNLQNNDNETALIVSAKYGHHRYVNNLIEKGANINAQDKHGNSALMIASKENYSDILENLLQHGAVKDLQNVYSETALFLATEYGHPGCVEVLLRHIADPSIENKFCETPLFVAIIRNIEERQIYKRNISIDFGNSTFNNSQIYKFYSDNAYQAPHTYSHLKLPFSKNRNDHEKIVDLLVTHNASISFKKHRMSLFTATKKGLSNVVKLLIGQQINVNVENFGKTALQIATECGWYDISKILLEAGARIEFYKNSALCEAASYGKLDIAKLLIENNARIDFRDVYKDTPLTQASRYNYTDIAKLLLEKGADPNAQNIYKETALMFAAFNSNTEIFNALFQSGAEVHVNVKDEKNRTPIYYAALKSNYEMVNQLIVRGAYLNVSPEDIDSHDLDNNEYDSDDDDPLSGDTVLLAALANNNFHIVELLVNNGAEVNTPNKCGTTPLWKAVYTGYYDIVKFLIEKGADYKYCDKNGKTLLHTASAKGFFDIASLLISYGVDINKRDENNKTPIFVASENNHYEIVKLLVEHGADLNVETTCGETALSVATKNNNRKIVKILKKYGGIEKFVGNIAFKKESLYDELSLYLRYSYAEQND